MKKKLGSIALILAILAGILSGCGNAPAASDKSTPESVQPSENETAAVSEAAPAALETDSVQTETSAVEEPVYEKVPVEVPFAEGETISMFLLIPPFISAQLSSTNELTVLGELERRTGLTFDITPGNYLDGSTDVNLLIASGDYPDIINHADLYSGGIEAAMEHNIVLDLHDYIMNDMPNFLAAMKSYDADALKQMTTASGRIGYFPQVHMRPYIDSFAIGLNQDVMDQLNLEIPKTFDQLHDVLSKAYGETGLQYGLSNQGTDTALMMGFGAPAFGTTGAGIEGFRVVDGKVEYGATTDSARAYLETMAQWFSEGLIYSDFLSYEDFQQTNMVAAGTLFGNGGVNAQHLVKFPLEEPFSISISMSTTPSLTGSGLIQDAGQDLGWAKWLHERTGADIQVDLYSFFDSADKQNLMIASGDYTDVIVGSLSYSGGYGFPEYSGGVAAPLYVENDQFLFPTENPEFQDYLKMMHQWYQEGLIYPDFLSQGQVDHPDSALINNGDIGAWFTYVAYLESEQAALSALEPQADIQGFSYPVKSAGDSNRFGKGAATNGVDGMGGFSVTTASSDVATLCAVLNEFYTPDGYTFANWGTENVTYTVDADGETHFTDLILQDEYGLGSAVMMTYYFFKDGPYQVDYDRYLSSYTDRQVEACEIWMTDNSGITSYTLTTDQSYEFYSYQSDVFTTYQEYVVKFITGDKDIDGDWQEFLEKLDGCGLQSLLELGQTGVAQYDERLEEAEALYQAYHEK